MTRHLLVVGAQRCGTTYLSAMLDAHPEIAMARPARPEPKAFMSADLAARGLEFYHSRYFSHATTESLLGEKSTSYLERADAAARAAVVLGRAEIVVLVRDPVARAVSNWRFSAGNSYDDRPLDLALTENLVGARPWDKARTSVSPYAYLERGRYADYLEPWYTAFPGSVHVRFFEDLVGPDSGRVLAGLYDALGVDPSVQPPCADQPVNGNAGQAPELDQALVDRLRAYFKDSDVRLAELLGRHLPWETAGQ